MRGKKNKNKTRSKQTHRRRDAGECKEAKQRSIKCTIRVHNPKNGLLIHILKNRTNLHKQSKTLEADETQDKWLAQYSSK